MSFGKAMQRALAATALVLIPVAISAQGVPTIDVTSIARLQEMISEAKLQLKEQVAQNVKLDTQTLKLIEQIQLLHSQISALKDGLTLADLGFDKESFLREIMPGFSDLTASLDAAKSGDWASVLADGGTLSGGTVSSHVDKAFASAGLERARVDQLAKSEEAPAARIGTAANVNAFMSVAAESSSQRARDSLTRIDGLVGKIEGTENLKQAIDLNTRVTVELGIALANVWAMQAVQTVGMGEAGIMDVATAADEEKYLSIKLEE
ncbi:type IV secretion system protein [Paracoccus ravus]|uniref:type IV secretion system protein n=1 Tax=Paracoccus ravus TaxID=2447760 RepID=UPI00106EFC41|nr:type IV secretion system protein [Paracoccus ravus]